MITHLGAKEEEEKDETNNFSYLKLRYGLIVISTSLLLIPIFYQFLLNQAFIKISYLQPLFVLGVFGYVILLADVLSDIFQIAVSIFVSSYKIHKPLLNKFFFGIVAFVVFLPFYVVWGLDAVKDILIALAIILLAWGWNKWIGKKSS